MGQSNLWSKMDNESMSQIQTLNVTMSQCNGPWTYTNNLTFVSVRPNLFYEFFLKAFFKLKLDCWIRIPCFHIQIHFIFNFLREPNPNDEPNLKSSV